MTSKPRAVQFFFCLFTFLFVYFFGGGCFQWIEVFFRVRVFLEYLQLFFNVVYSLALFVMISPLSYFLPKYFASLTYRCWYVFTHSLLTCWTKFISVFWNVLFCLHYLILSQYLFSLPPLFVPTACSCRFFSISNLISHLGFDFLYVFFGEPRFFLV